MTSPGWGLVAIIVTAAAFYGALLVYFWPR